MNNLLLLLILAHLLSDFLLQNNKVVQLKGSFNYSGYLVHLALTFGVTFLLIFNYGLYFALVVATILAVIHIVFDIIKGLIGIPTKNNQQLQLLLFLCDQVLHFMSILFIWARFKGYLDKSRPVFQIRGDDPLWGLLDGIAIDSRKLLLLLIFYTGIMFAGAVLLEHILNLVNNGRFRDTNNQAGYYIGIIERALVLTLITFGPISSLGLILTAKSLARFSKLSEKEFAEYYLMGTLTSLAIALIGGLLLKYLLNIQG